MRCSACRAEPPAGKKFCSECGAALKNRCPQCAAVNPANKKFCGASLNHRLRAEILLDMDGNAVEEPEALFGQSLEIARRQEAKTFELRAATSLARLWQPQGKRGTSSEAGAKADAARDLPAPVYEWFTEGFDTRDLKDAKVQLEELGR